MKRYRGELLILFGTLAWGASYLFTKVALRTVDAFNLVGIRFTIACIVTVLAFLRIARRIGKAELFFGGCLGALLFTSASLLATGVSRTSISNAGFLIGSMVLFVAIMDAAVSRKKPRPPLLLGILLALAGIAILTLRGELAVNPGDLLCLGASIVLAIHVMVAQQTGLRADAVGASIVQFATAGVLGWIASGIHGGTMIVPPWPAWGAGVVLGIWGTAIAFVCQVVGQKYVSPTRTAFLFTLEPVFATLFAWLFMAEPVTWHVYAGGGLLLAGVYVSEYNSAGTPAAEAGTSPENKSSGRFTGG